MYNCVWYFCTYPYRLSLNGWCALLCIAKIRHGVTITTHAIKRHYLIWVTTMRQPTKHRRSCVLTFKYSPICVYWWTKQRIHNTLIVVNRYLQLMGDYKNPLQLDVVDRYLRRMGDKNDSNRFIPHESQVSIYHNQGVMDSLSRSPINTN